MVPGFSLFSHNKTPSVPDVIGDIDSCDLAQCKRSNFIKLSSAASYKGFLFKIWLPWAFP